MQLLLDTALAGLRAMRTQDGTRDLSSHIEGLLRQSWSEHDAAALRGELIAELHRHDRLVEAEALLRTEVGREPTEPYHSLCLAEHFHYYDVDLSKSLKQVAEAVSKAEADGKFLYQALGAQARLAIETKDWSLLESTLIKLATYDHIPGKVDVFPEADFLSRVPSGVAAEAMAVYIERLEHLRSIGYSTMYGPRIE
jgi:hypothetical protein